MRGKNASGWQVVSPAFLDSPSSMNIRCSDNGQHLANLKSWIKRQTQSEWRLNSMEDCWADYDMIFIVLQYVLISVRHEVVCWPEQKNLIRQTLFYGSKTFQALLLMIYYCGGGGHSASLISYTPWSQIFHIAHKIIFSGRKNKSLTDLSRFTLKRLFFYVDNVAFRSDV
jgi:hypothetical protein